MNNRPRGITILFPSYMLFSTINQLTVKYLKNGKNDVKKDPVMIVPLVLVLSFYKSAVLQIYLIKRTAEAKMCLLLFQLLRFHSNIKAHTRNLRFPAYIWERNSSTEKSEAYWVLLVIKNYTITERYLARSLVESSGQWKYRPWYDIWRNR